MTPRRKYCPVRLGSLTVAALLLGTTVATTSAIRPPTGGLSGPEAPGRMPQSAGQTPPASGTDEPEALRIGEATTVKVCTECHEFDQVVALRRTPREWKDMVTTMANKGATGTAAEFAQVRQYLTRSYGVVGVNTAAASDFSAVLGLSSKDADAVVFYRTAHGKFADIDALLKVPGLDKSRIEDQAEAIRFD